MISPAQRPTPGVAADPLALAPPAGARKTTQAAPLAERTDELVPFGAAGAASTRGAGRATKTSGAGYASSAKTGAAKTSTAKKASTAKKSTSTKKTSTPRTAAFLDDPRLTVEEKLFRFMLMVADSYDRQLEQKMKELASGAKKTGGAGASTGSGAKKKSSFLGTFVKAATVLFPGVGITLEILKQKEAQALVKSLSGPVLAAGATALGFPQLAPVLASAGPEIANAAIGLASAVDLDGGEGAGAKSAAAGATGSGSSKTSSSSSSSGSTTVEPEVSRQDMLELEHLMEKQKEMFGLVSNMLRAMHDTRMAIITNVRA